jgi:hypothetical protein
METISIKRKFMEPVKLILSEAFDNALPKKNKYSFTAVVLVWDPALDYEWSIVSRNGVRYHRDYSVKNFKAAVKHNQGIPFLYNHMMENDKIEQLGLVTEIEDTGKEMVVKGFLNGNKPRVAEEILTGFLNNVSLQVDGDRFEVEEGGDTVVYAKPTDVYEISAVPVQGIPGANLFDICLCEAVKASQDKEVITNKEALTYTDDEAKLMGFLAVETEEKIAALQDGDNTSMQYYAQEKNVNVANIDLDKMYYQLRVNKADERTVNTVSTDDSNDGADVNVTVNNNTQADEEIITLEATTSNCGGATGTALHGRDEEDADVSNISKDEIEDELSAIEEGIDKEALDVMFSEVKDEMRYDELKHEAIEESN